MRRIFGFLALAAVCTLFFAAARAQAQEEPVSTLLVPTSGWLVGPASLAEGLGAAMPCVMLNQYNNGYNLRFSGGDGRILAMAIDFRQDAFRAGTPYEMTIAVRPDFEEKVTATALNGGTILINTQKYAGLYEALEKGKALSLSVNGAALDFLLAGAPDGLARIEQCKNPASKQAAVRPGEKEIVVDPSIDSALQGAAEKLSATAPMAGASESAPVVAAQVQPSEGGRMDKSTEASITPAVGKPLAGSWLSPAVPQRAGMHQRDIMVTTAAAAESREPVSAGTAAERRWRAMKGMDLREILDTWARSENVRIVWQAGRDYALRDTLGARGTFEDAVQMLLEQFRDDPRRPVGKIFMDPSMGQKVLVIETAGGR